MMLAATSSGAPYITGLKWVSSASASNSSAETSASVVHPT